jgi:protein Mpv17
MISSRNTLGALVLASILAQNSIAGFQSSSLPSSTAGSGRRMKRRHYYVPSSTPRTELSMLEGAASSFDIDTFYHTQPYLAAFLTCSVKASAADLLAQSKQNNNNNNNNNSLVSNGGEPSINLMRNLSFVLYGGFYQGMGQCFLFTHLYPSLFGTVPTLTTVLAQASLDNFVLAPFFCLPTVYTIKSLLAGGTPQQGICKYKNHIWSQQLLLRYWAIWFPVQCLNFGVVPEHLRVPFCAVISFFWVCLLSSITAQEQASEKEPSAVVVSCTVTASASSTPFFAFPRGGPDISGNMPQALGTTILMFQPPTMTSSKSTKVLDV